MKEYTVEINTDIAEEYSNEGAIIEEYDIPITKIQSMVKGCLKHISADEESDDAQSRTQMHKLIASLKNKKAYIGSADDFHNFAVDLAQNNEYALACDILDCGLVNHPENVDLLSDYLMYGMKCARKGKCRQHYQTLLNISKKKWTWRGFSFIIDYMQLTLRQEELDQKHDEMLEIIQTYQKYFPYSEDGYCKEADMYNEQKMLEKKEQILFKAVKNVNVCPKSALMLADILKEKGDYDEALKAIEKGLSGVSQTQSSVADGYVYYLLGLCKMAKLNGRYIKVKESIIHDILSDFDIAVAEFEGNSTYIKNIKSKVDIIVKKTGIEITEKHKDLYELMSESN